MVSDSKLIVVISAILGITLGFVAYNNTTNDEGSFDLFEIPMAYGHFADDYPLECGLIPSLEQCNKTFTHEIRDWIFDLLLKLIGDQFNPIN